jgi:hypothetical protein
VVSSSPSYSIILPLLISIIKPLNSYSLGLRLIGNPIRFQDLSNLFSSPKIIIFANLFPSNAPTPISSKLSGILTLVSWFPSNAPCPIFHTLSGILRLSN